MLESELGTDRLLEASRRVWPLSWYFCRLVPKADSTWAAVPDAAIVVRSLATDREALALQPRRDLVDLILCGRELSFPLRRGQVMPVVGATGGAQRLDQRLGATLVAEIQHDLEIHRGRVADGPDVVCAGLRRRRRP